MNLKKKKKKGGGGGLSSASKIILKCNELDPAEVEGHGPNI